MLEDVAVVSVFALVVVETNDDPQDLVRPDHRGILPAALFSQRRLRIAVRDDLAPGARGEAVAVQDLKKDQVHVHGV